MQWTLLSVVIACKSQMGKTGNESETVSFSENVTFGKFLLYFKFNFHFKNKLQTGFLSVWLHGEFQPGLNTFNTEKCWKIIVTVCPGWVFQPGFKNRAENFILGWNSAWDETFFMLLQTSFQEDFFWKPSWNLSPGWNSPCNQALTKMSKEIYPV